MIRFLVYVIIGYFLWKFIQSITSFSRKQPTPNKPPARPAPPRTFSNVKDAEFEDLTPKKSQAPDGTGPGGSPPGGSAQGGPGPSRPTGA